MIKASGKKQIAPNKAIKIGHKIKAKRKFNISIQTPIKKVAIYSLATKTYRKENNRLDYFIQSLYRRAAHIGSFSQISLYKIGLSSSISTTLPVQSKKQFPSPEMKWPLIG